MSGWHRYAFAAWGALVAAGCAGPPDEQVEVPPEAAEHAREMTFGNVAEMEAELDVLDHEIAGLAEYLAARPDPPAPGDPDPRDVLEAARATRAAAAAALAAADTARAADSLRAAAARVEHVKRLLGVAEEMGVEFEPDRAAPAAD